MSTAFEEITEQALRLPRQERLALANRLLSDDADVNSSAIEAAWEEEIIARIREIDDGTAVGIPYEAVIRAARDRRAK
ncbi:MAG TPA: addiction module protein [Pyrinomonadaceae bacterium]|jgi:putative addiction module component (TIGR02574 family)|nr:addiction module protein [Pyrinomonadaceae bacterium]